MRVDVFEAGGRLYVRLENERNSVSLLLHDALTFEQAAEYLAKLGDPPSAPCRQTLDGVWCVLSEDHVGGHACAMSALLVPLAAKRLVDARDARDAAFSAMSRCRECTPFADLLCDEHAGRWKVAWEAAYAAEQAYRAAVEAAR